MAATAWQLYNDGKRYIGNGTIELGVSNFKMALFRTSASATVNNFALSTFGSLAAEISATGGYTAGGKALVPATGQWTAGVSAKQMKFTYSAIGLTFTANALTTAPTTANDLNNIRYAVIYKDATASAAKLLCFCALSSAQFTVSSPNTLTVLPAATGVFTLT
jgi:hypothetical protein